MPEAKKLNNKNNKSSKSPTMKSRLINEERFKRISKWRKSQKIKQQREKDKISKEKEMEREIAQRKVLKKIQLKRRKENVLRVKLEAEKLRNDHEKMRKEMEKDFFKEKKGEKQEEEKAINDEISDQTKNQKDPLDEFMEELKKEKIKPKKRKIANVQISDFMKKQIDKLKPKRKKLLLKEKNEVLENETLYEASDLVIHEEASWLDKMRQKKKEIKPVDHSKIEYDEFKKNFYIEAPEITAMTEKEVEEYRHDKLEGVKIRGKDCPRPIKKWSQCGLPSKIYSILSKFEYSEPFPIQCQAIPCIMSGRDVIACAKTGSGKTLAFILPMFRHILDQQALSADDGPIGLIISPTRELAKQTFFETNKFALNCGLRVVCCHGGATVADQIADLKRGAEIIVGTPGRLIDMLSVNGGRVTNVKRVTYLVLDEADRMFDMGFEPQIMTIINNIRPSRQTVLFSATFPKQIEGLVRQIMQTPVEIVIGDRSVASNSIVQTVKILEEYEKFNALLKILGENYNKGQILIFTDRQESVDNLFSSLQKAGYFTLTLHGGMDQSDRDSMVMDFKNKTRSILIATSIASRGLDIKDLNLVINYTVPNHYEDYIHRIGRTGRAGKKGFAITFLTPEDEKFAPDLLKALRTSKQKEIPFKLKEMVNKFKEKLKKGQAKLNQSVRSSGSKGFKFDETEQYQHKLEKKRQEASYGASADKEMSEKDVLNKQNEVIEEQISFRDSQLRAKRKPMTAIDKQLAAAKAGAAAIKTTINATSATHNIEEIQALAQVAYQSVFVETQRADISTESKSRAEAVARNLAISQKLTSLGAAATPTKLAAAINKKQFCRKFEINDYPQVTRAKVINKKTIEQVREFSDVIITQRGSFFAPGRVPRVGEEKLALMIEGRTMADVERAYYDLRQIAEESAKSSTAAKQSYSRYQVV